MALKRIRTQAEYDANYAESVKDPEGFWTAQADTFKWHQKWNTALEWDFETPNVKWFAGGKLNITENCLDRHLKKRGNKLAIIWEPNDPKERFVRLTYRELHEKVCQYANVLKRNGAKKGDRVCVYMPMVPGAGDRRAGLRAHRGHPQRGVLRLQRAEPGRPHQDAEAVTWC